jgi:hypothetical protein
MTMIADSPPALHGSDTETSTTTVTPQGGGRRSRSWTRRWGRRVASEGGVVVILSCALYLAVALILDFKTLSFNGDAVARMANGFYVLYSRDPHLAAIGFVWNPLQSLLDIVPLLFKDLWPALASHNMAGSIVSVLCMVGAVHQTRAALREWGVARAPRLVITALFALNPMILLYSGNGMSEALYLFTLVATTRYLTRWIHQDDLRSLVYAAVALGFCYLARNEAVVPAVAAMAVVFFTSYHRDSGIRKHRIMHGCTDAVIFILPVVTTFVGWAVASYIIVGELFAQFASQYGTTAQIAAGAGGPKQPLGFEIRLVAHALEYMAPLLVVVAVAAVAVAWRRRDPLILGPIAVVGGGLATDVAGVVNHSIIWAFRYVITTIPLEMLLVGVILAGAAQQGTGGYRHRERSHRMTGYPASASQPVKHWRPWLVSAAGVLVALVALGPSVPATAAGMFNPKVGVEEVQELGYVFHHPLTKKERMDKEHFATIQAISDYLAHLHVPEGDILIDNSSECVPEVITTVPDPRIFVIPNDRDFQKLLADPLTFHVHYIMVPPSSGPNANTATDKLYPALYATGAGFARKVHTFPSGGLCPSFRLYRVIGHPNVLD